MKFLARVWLERLERLDPPLSFVFALTTLALFVRMPDLLLTPSLWAEDLSLFIEDFLNFGLASLVRPAHGPGYHLLFPRLVTGSLAFIPLKHAELVFHVVDVCVIYFAFVMTWLCLPTRSFTSRVTACLAILYVPINSWPIYLNLVNTQWILGGITILMIATDYVSHSRHKVLWCAVLAVLCLTGPFSVLALPVVVARVLYYRDLKREWLFYSSILLPAIVQLVTLGTFAAARLDVSASPSMNAWFKGLAHLARFIPSRPLFLLFVAFLGVLLWKLARQNDRRIALQGSCLLLAAACITAAGFYALRNRPELVGPFGHGERYFFVPFLLLIFFVLSTARGAADRGARWPDIEVDADSLPARVEMGCETLSCQIVGQMRLDRDTCIRSSVEAERQQSPSSDAKKCLEERVLLAKQCYPGHLLPDWGN